MNRFIIIVSTITLAASAASAHPHVTMTPPSSAAGAQLVITTYGEDSLGVTSENGRDELHLGGSIYTVTADTLMTTGDYPGTHRGSIINFAADNSPLLASAGGPVGYEVLSFVRVGDGDATASLTWRFFGHNANPAASGHTLRWADSTASTASARSFLHNPGDHVHATPSDPTTGFFIFTSGVGLYDVTIRAWDTSGHFAPSDPIVFRVNAVPEPAAASAMLVMAAALFRRTGRRTSIQRRDRTI